jgi:hypothetical protein
MGHHPGSFVSGLDTGHLDRQCADVDSYIGHGGSDLGQQVKKLRGQANTGDPINF